MTRNNSSSSRLSSTLALATIPATTASSLIALTALLGGCYQGVALPETDTAPDRVSGQYVVGISDDATEADLQALAEAEGLELVAVRGGDRVAVLVDPQQRDDGELQARLADSPTTAYAEPDWIYRPVATVNDYGEYMWGLHNTGVAGGTVGADINAFDAWDLSTGEGVVVAIIDSGSDVTHPDLAPNLWTNTGEIADNGIDDDNNGYVDDVHGYDFLREDGDPNDEDSHGTHVAGSVAAAGDDGYGVPGVAYGAQIMPLKFLGANDGGHSSDAAAAINYAVNNGADIINASWGGGGYSTAIRDAIAYANSRGVVFVAAAGNAGTNNDSNAFYPAGYELDNLISVGASDRKDQLADFSNYGDTVDLTAPGVDIVSTLPGASFGYMDGTSMASPYVSGAAALLKAANPALSPADIRAALMATVEPLALGAEDIGSGGRIDAFAALQWVLPDEEPPATGDDDDDSVTEPEPEPEPEAEWSYVEYGVESPHPYSNDFSGSATVEAPAGATEMILHFDRIDT